MLNRRILTAALAAAALAVPATALSAQDEVPPATVIDVLEAQGNHTTFLQAIRAAGLEETLRGSGPFTVFAPTDDAFAKLPEGRLGELMADEAALRALVAEHIISGSIAAADVTEPASVETLEGSSIDVTPTEQGVRISVPAPAAEVAGGADAPAATVFATVTTADQTSSNGVVHAIDTVLIASRD